MSDLTVLETDDILGLVDRLRRGDVFIFPTDTAFGLGASVRHTEAVGKVFSLKNRSPDRTVPVLTTRKTARTMANFNEAEQRAIERFWPGELTVVVSAKDPDEYPDGIVRDGTIALRMPGHESLLKLLRKSPPITGTSANRTGEPAPFNRDEIDDDLLNSVDFLLDGDAGAEQPSTVAEWNQEQQVWTIHREGPVSREELVKVSGSAASNQPDSTKV